MHGKTTNQTAAILAGIATLYLAAAMLILGVGPVIARLDATFADLGKTVEFGQWLLLACLVPALVFDTASRMRARAALAAGNC